MMVFTKKGCYKIPTENDYHAGEAAGQNACVFIRFPKVIWCYQSFNTNGITFGVKMSWLSCHGSVTSGLHRAWKLAASNQFNWVTTCVVIIITLSVTEITMKLHQNKYNQLEDLTEQLASPLESDERLTTQRNILEHNIHKRSPNDVFTEEIDVQSSPLPGRSLNDRIFESVGDVYQGALLKFKAATDLGAITTTLWPDPDWEHYGTYTPNSEVEQMRIYMSMLNLKKLRTTPFPRKPLSIPPDAQWYDINITPIMPLPVTPAHDSRRFMEPGVVSPPINPKFRPPIGHGIAFPGIVRPPSMVRFPEERNTPILPYEDLSPLEHFRALYPTTTKPKILSRRPKVQPVRNVPVKTSNLYTPPSKPKDIEEKDSSKLPDVLKEEEMDEEENLFDIPEFKAEASYKKPKVLTDTDENITKNKMPDTRRMSKNKMSMLSETKNTNTDVIQSLKKRFKTRPKKPKVLSENKNKYGEDTYLVKLPQFEDMNIFRKKKIEAEMKDEYDDDTDSFIPKKLKSIKNSDTQPDFRNKNIENSHSRHKSMRPPINADSFNDDDNHKENLKESLKLFNILEHAHSDNDDLNIKASQQKMINAVTKNTAALSQSDDSMFNPIGKESKSNQEPNKDLKELLIPGVQEKHQKTGKESEDDYSSDNEDARGGMTISGIPIRRRRYKVPKRILIK